MVGRTQRNWHQAPECGRRLMSYGPAAYRGQCLESVQRGKASIIRFWSQNAVAEGDEGIIG
ncbi:hypothetical protein GCM10025790_01040 [Nesterenkonia rhizosphaerae]|uniref:Uncharacterized protein n=1 Tax=Nesterenkonia rhizosphaerae TaxID=1348272 RepID=A0ABP9FPC0_9MICC